MDRRDEELLRTGTCPHCGLKTVDEAFCPDCGVRTGPEESEPASGRENRVLRLEVVYRAGDDLAAMTVKKVLEAEGIECFVDSLPLGGFDGLAGNDGHWGRLLVYEDCRSAAQRCIERYLASMEMGPH